MTTTILTIMDFIIIIFLIAGWYFKPTLLQDGVAWVKNTVTGAINYFKK
jgi:hypothetical protein